LADHKAKTFSAVVLAAGTSQRTGEQNKLLARIDNKVMILIRKML